MTQPHGVSKYVMYAALAFTKWITEAQASARVRVCVCTRARTDCTRTRQTTTKLSCALDKLQWQRI